MNLVVAMLTVLISLTPIHAFAQSAPQQVDLEIVLAVDASGSVSADEFQLQMRGIGAAFRDPEIHSAIASGSHRRIAVAVMIWADGNRPKDKTEWYVIASPAQAFSFADVVEAHPRRVGGGTGIGDGIAYAMEMISRNQIDSLRAVIDVSGDGKETPPREITTILLPQARAMAVSRDVTINGLAILADVPGLDVWYRDNVTAGPGSFVMKADGFDDFAVAMKQKLLREIAVRIGGLRPGTGPVPPHSPASTRQAAASNRLIDCQIGLNLPYIDGIKRSEVGGGFIGRHQNVLGVDNIICSSAINEWLTINTESDVTGSPVEPDWQTGHRSFRCAFMCGTFDGER